MATETLMPLMGSAFEPGSGAKTVEEFPTEEQRAIARAELAYFQGRAEDAIEFAKPYLDAADDGMRCSAYLLSVYSNLSLGKIAEAKFCLNRLEEPAKSASNPASYACACFTRDAALSLLHLNDKPVEIPTQVASELSIGVRMFYAYVKAHQAYLDGKYGYSLGLAESALSLAPGTYPIPTIYLHLVSCMDCMSLRDIEHAKRHFMDVWELSAPDHFVEGVAEHHGLLGGLIETCVKPVDPETYNRIIEITYRFSAGWRRIHNPRRSEEVADNLTTIEFTVAMLTNRGWWAREVASFLEISENTVKTHLKNVYKKLGISKKSELDQFMLR
jgi:DNA-binding CsgD family transcriptional regulator